MLKGKKHSEARGGKVEEEEGAERSDGNV